MGAKIDDFDNRAISSNSTSPRKFFRGVNKFRETKNCVRKKAKEGHEPPSESFVVTSSRKDINLPPSSAAVFRGKVLSVCLLPGVLWGKKRKEEKKKILLSALGLGFYRAPR